MMTRVRWPMLPAPIELPGTFPVTTYTSSYFLTARLAARRMIPNKSGVIMTVTALHSRTGLPLVGGYGPAMAAKEALTRDLSAELAPAGLRVVGLRPQAMPETPTIKDAFEPRAKASGMTWEQWQEFLASRTHPRRLMALEEVANMAVFLASDKASGMTGTTVNLTMAASTTDAYGAEEYSGVQRTCAIRSVSSSSQRFGATPSAMAWAPTAWAMRMATSGTSAHAGSSGWFGSVRAGEASPRVAAATRIISSVTRVACAAVTASPIAGKI
jgi:hypothetical protein